MPVRFVCNLCSQPTEINSFSDMDQEGPSCSHCASNARFRWIVHSLSTAFFGRSLHLREFPPAKHLKGIGLSDERVYSARLSETFNYTNTYFHCEPRFDIKEQIDGEPESLDFIIASEVFEHVTPPVQPAFDNLNRLLKPGGLIFFSTPWRPSGATEEHFPDLFDWTVTPFRDKHVLLNKTVGGQLQTFTELCFHGGPGETLEMRVFALPDLVRNFERARLSAQFFKESVPGLGIVYRLPWSLPCVVRKLADLKGIIESVTPQEAENASLQSQIATLYGQIAVQNQREAELVRERDLVKESKWLRLGNRLGFGPKLL